MSFIWSELHFVKLETQPDIKCNCTIQTWRESSKSFFSMHVKKKQHTEKWSFQIWSSSAHSIKWLHLIFHSSVFVADEWHLPHLSQLSLTPSIAAAICSREGRCSTLKRLPPAHDSSPALTAVQSIGVWFMEKRSEQYLMLLINRMSVAEKHPC